MGLKKSLNFYMLLNESVFLVVFFCLEIEVLSDPEY